MFNSGSDGGDSGNSSPCFSSGNSKAGEALGIHGRTDLMKREGSSLRVFPGPHPMTGLRRKPTPPEAQKKQNNEKFQAQIRELQKHSCIPMISGKKSPTTTGRKSRSFSGWIKTMCSAPWRVSRLLRRRCSAQSACLDLAEITRHCELMAKGGNLDNAAIIKDPESSIE